MAYGKLHLPEHSHEVEQLLELIATYNRKLSEHHEPINLMPEDENNFINTFRRQYERSIAHIQQHYSIRVSECSTVEFFTYTQLLEQKSKARTNPGFVTSNVQKLNKR